MKFPFVWFTLIFCIVSGCSDNLESEKTEIQNYINNNGLETTDTAGVYIVVENEGSSARPKESSIIELTYTARYLDEIVFDQSPINQTVKIKLSSALNGLKIGLSRFGIGGKGTIIFPSSLGYGNNPPFGVRKDEVLIYTVHVINF